MLRGSLLLALLFAGAFFARAGEVLDRVVATVNGHVILLSDLNDELRFESFMAGTQVSSIGPEQTKAALDRLIDQELLREQMTTADLKPIAPEEIEKQIESLKEDYLREHPGASWQSALSKYQLTEKFIDQHVNAELTQLHFVDARFRSTIQIMPDEVEQYYKKELLPGLPASGRVSLAEATQKIREILIQRKIDQLLTPWLETLRAQAQIRLISADSDSNSSASGVGRQ